MQHLCTPLTNTNFKEPDPHYTLRHRDKYICIGKDKVECLIKMKLFFVFLCLLLQLTKGENQQSEQSGCHMLRRRVLVHHETSSLIYISQMWTEVKDQQRDEKVRNSTAKMLLQSLERMSNDWCDPSHRSVSNNKKTKRSLSTILATIFAFGSLIIGPAIAAVLQEISHNTKWRLSEAKSGLETARILAEFEKRLNANSRVEEILASIMLHESILSDLLQNSDSNRTWKKIFKHQIKEFKELGLIDEDDDIFLGREENLLPKGTYKFESSVHKNRDCGETRVTIKAIGLIPDKTCFHLHREQDEDYTKLQTSTNITCIFAGRDSTTLPGNKTFITSNTIVGPCENKERFIFKSKENTLLVRPKSSRGYMTSKCGKKVIRRVLYRDQYYILPLKCTSWISNEKRRSVNEETDYFQSEETLLSATTGKEITNQETQPTLIFYAVEGVKDLESKDVEITKVDLNYVENFLEKFSRNREKDSVKPNNTNTKIVPILVSTLFMIAAAAILLKIRKKLQLRLGLIAKFLQGVRERETSVNIPNIETLEGVSTTTNKEDKRGEAAQNMSKRREGAFDQEDEETEYLEDTEYETIRFLPAKTTLIKSTTKQKELHLFKEPEITKMEQDNNREDAVGASTRDQDVPRRTLDKKEDRRKRRNRETRIYYEDGREGETEDTGETDYENIYFLKTKHIATVHRELDYQNCNNNEPSVKDSDDAKAKDLNLVTSKVLQEHKSKCHEDSIPEKPKSDKEKTPDSTTTWEEHADVSEGHNLEEEKDAETGTQAEPIYDVPRKLYNKKTKANQEEAGAIELNAYSDDLVVRWVMPTVEENAHDKIIGSRDKPTEETLTENDQETNILDTKEKENSNKSFGETITLTEKDQKTKCLNTNEEEDSNNSPNETLTMKRNKKRSEIPSQGTLHARLMKELHNRFLDMKTEHNL